MAKKVKNAAVTPVESGISLIDESLLKSRIYTIRGVKVMIDADLAEIYGYSTKKFNEQVKNNIEKFDEDFRFRLTSEEFENLRSKNWTSRCGNSPNFGVFYEKDNLRSKKSTSSWGGSRYVPYAFTEQGIYMLMTVLKGERATAQSKALIRLFKQMYVDLQMVMENFVDPSTYRHRMLRTMRQLSADAKKAGSAGMTLDEINAEITAARRGK